MKREEKITTKKGLQKEWENAVDKNQDPYGHGVVQATVAACRVLDEGKTPEEAVEASRTMEITPFMAGCMAQWISHFHPRGEEFRVCWNGIFGLEDEGKGVVNPALVTVRID